MSTSKIAQYANDPLSFLADLIIPSVRGRQRFGDVMADFQRERFEVLAPALLAVCRGERPPIGRHWWEATKGASKDSDLACCLLWLAAFAKRPLDCQVGAADADQADELRKAARDVLYLNPWLAQRVTIQNRRILCEATGATCEIIPADVGGSHGSRPDVLIVNELSHVTKQEFAENLMDNAAKVPHGLVVVATNAGFIDTWQHRWRQLAIDSDRWFVHRWAQPAPWLDTAEIEEAKRRNSRSRFLRLWYGVWSSGAGDAIDPDDIAACTDPAAEPLTGEEPEYGWLAGLDLGVKRDRSSLVVLGIDAVQQRARLAACVAWSPGPSGVIDLEAVEIGILQAAWQFPGVVIGFDPWQAEYMAQRLRRCEGLRVAPVPFTGKNCNDMASAVLQVFRSRMIELYPDRELIRDLGKLTIVERSYGYKLEAPRDKTGHADRATAFAIAALGIMPSIGDYCEPIDDGLGHSLLGPYAGGRGF